jgi:hypothetical protein
MIIAHAEDAVVTGPRSARPSRRTSVSSPLAVKRPRPSPRREPSCSCRKTTSRQVHRAAALAHQHQCGEPLQGLPRGHRRFRRGHPTFVSVPTEWNPDLFHCGTVNALRAKPAANCMFLASDFTQSAWKGRTSGRRGATRSMSGSPRRTCFRRRWWRCSRAISTWARPTMPSPMRRRPSAWPTWSPRGGSRPRRTSTRWRTSGLAGELSASLLGSIPPEEDTHQVRAQNFRTRLSSRLRTASATIMPSRPSAPARSTKIAPSDGVIAWAMRLGMAILPIISA